MAAARAPGTGSVPSAGAGASSAGRANSSVSTSVSDVATGIRFGWPGLSSSRSASSRVLIRLPLWARARPPSPMGRNVGWAFSHTEDPEVEYRQWPTAM